MCSIGLRRTRERKKLGALPAITAMESFMSIETHLRMAVIACKDKHPLLGTVVLGIGIVNGIPTNFRLGHGGAEPGVSASPRWFGPPAIHSTPDALRIASPSPSYGHRVE